MKKLLIISLATICAAAANAVTLTFNSKGHGEMVDTDFPGLTISAVTSGGLDQAAIFDSEFGGTTEDTDLLRSGGWAGGNLATSTFLGKLLYAQDDERPGTTGDFYDDPDDEVGATITLEFTSIIDRLRFDFVDIESSESLTVEFFKGAVSVLGPTNVGDISTAEGFGNRTANRTDLVDLAGLDVDRVDFIFSGSGAIDNIHYGVPDSGMTLGLLAIALGGLASLRRRFGK